MTITQQQLTDTLHQRFGYTEFRDGQREVVTAVTQGQHTLAVLPTGAGKTLLYQLPGYLLSGTVVIVSPLISLMQDQVARLHEQGEKRVTMLSSLQSMRDRVNTLHHLGQYRFVFASPEVLAQDTVKQALTRITINLFVIDEAHCVSQWGPDFRPDYLMIKQLLKELRWPTVLMLTATATPRVQTDIIHKLGLDEQPVRRVIKSVNRDNIYLAVRQCADQQDKITTLVSLVTQLRGAGIVYFSSRKQASWFAQLLAEQTSRRVAAYHAGIDQITRYQVQHQFMNNELDLICATNAFGMGIDKNDIRYVIHFHMPANLENYVQEIGRAGRDGQQSSATLLYTPGDEQIPRQLSLGNLPTPAIIERYVQHQIKPESLGEMADVLNYYVQSGVSTAEMSALFRKRAVQSEQSLQTMLAYVQATDCRRNAIRHYFGENDGVHNAQCCDIDAPEDQLRQLGLINNPAEETVPTEPTETAKSWETKLAHLFFVKS